MVRRMRRSAASSSGVQAAKPLAVTVEALAAAYPSSACCSCCSSPSRSVSAISSVASASARATAANGEAPGEEPGSPRKYSTKTRWYVGTCSRRLTRVHRPAQYRSTRSVTSTTAAAAQ